LGSFLFLLRLEFLAYILLLIYLGGILIFFLFASLLVNPNFTNKRYEMSDLSNSIQNLIVLLFFFKIGYYLTCINEKICVLLFENNVSFLPVTFDTHIESLKNQGLFFSYDSYCFIRLYEDKAILLITVITILFFVIFGVITICYKKCPVKS